MIDYQSAWQRLVKEIEGKTSWGKRELVDLMLECLINPTKGKKDESNTR